MPITRVLVLVAIVALTAPAQTTWHVPGDFATPQAAIDSVMDGDTIVVGPGTYTGPLILHRAVTVVSSGGPDVTDFVGNAVGPAVYIGLPLDHPSGPLPRVSGFHFEGFTMRNAVSSGLWVENCDGIVANCVVRDNASTDRRAGAAWIREAGVDFDRCLFVDNRGTDGVDALPVGPIFPPIGFSTPGSGGPGGLTMSGTSTVVTLRNCLVAGNTGGDGGDAQILLPPAVANGAVGGAGAISLGDGATLVLDHTTVVANAGGAGGAGAGIGSIPGAPGFAGIVVGHATAALAVTRSVVWSHGGQSVSGAATIMSSDIEGGFAGTGNLAVPPLFADATGGDFHLTSGSPCRDAAGPIAATPTDFDGNPRLLDGGADMGFDEFATLYDGTGEDLALWSTLDGEGMGLTIKPVAGGEVLVNHVESPAGTLAGAFPILVVEAVANGVQPLGVPGFPSLHFDPGLVFILHDGLASQTPLGGGFTLGPVVVPPGFLTGYTLRYQALGVTPLAQNGIFAASRADDILFP